MRLDKFLVEMGRGSRSEVKEIIKKGRVSVNGIVVKASDQKIDEDKDEIVLDGSYVGYVEYEYYLLNKPAGVVSATEDKRDKTVLDLITSKTRTDLFPVGRLDKDTEGLLLITNDGDLCHRLLSPKKHVDKVYYAQIRGFVGEENISLFEEGILLSDGTKTLPACLEILRADKESETSEIRLTIHEGKFHQVKRMFEAIGCEVTYLKRLSMGPLVLEDTLELGMFRPLTDEEIKELYEVQDR